MTRYNKRFRANSVLLSIFKINELVHHSEKGCKGKVVEKQRPPVFGEPATPGKQDVRLDWLTALAQGPPHQSPGAPSSFSLPAPPTLTGLARGKHSRLVNTLSHFPSPGLHSRHPLPLKGSPPHDQLFFPVIVFLAQPKCFLLHEASLNPHQEMM